MMADSPHSPPLRESREGSTAILTLDQPSRRNALSITMRCALIDAFERIEPDRTLSAVVITGAEGTFCSGGDLSDMEVPDIAAGRERFRTTHKLVRLILGGTKPVIAAVEGFAAGAGLSLAALCDTIIAGENACFIASFGKVGLVADLGLLHTLPRRVGEGHARQILLYGERLPATEAFRIGLADEVVPPGGALAAALARSRRLAEQAPLPVALTRAFLTADLDAALEREREMQTMLFLSADHAEGKAAFLARRPPRFKVA
jgi:2-(1,2-epoxy-1,2-dihydrophenyl)acetyl-CoA isomerase